MNTEKQDLLELIQKLKHDRNNIEDMLEAAYERLDQFDSDESILMVV